MAEFFRGKAIYPIVSVAMTGDFVSLIRYRFDYVGESLSTPAEDKKGGTGAVALKLLQEASGIAFQSAFEVVPGIAFESPLKRLHDKPFFKIDGEEV